MNRHGISMKNMVDICDLSSVYENDNVYGVDKDVDMACMDKDLHTWLTSWYLRSRSLQLPLIARMSKNSLDASLVFHDINKLLRQLFLWLNLPARDRTESASQVAFDNDKNKSGHIEDISSTASFTIPCVQKLVRAILKELRTYSIGFWEFVGKVRRLLEYTEQTRIKCITYDTYDAFKSYIWPHNRPYLYRVKQGYISYCTVTSI